MSGTEQQDDSTAPGEYAREVEEPSTEKEPGEEPKAPKEHDPQPDHQAVGIGVVDGAQSDAAGSGES
ncbi:hypothetical protein WDU99_10165 [Microbacterium sp. Mu-80]|uniref:Uncharacterized protein n=1 Tax=Microbacterium bandirmense TaxID=3122050 RepID=A0ABU8LCH1_9MICO